MLILKSSRGGSNPGRLTVLDNPTFVYVILLTRVDPLSSV